MKVILAVVSSVAVGFLVQRVLAAEPRSDMPPGVEASDWIAISDAAGFLVTPEKAAASQSLGGRQVLTGHFFAKKKGQWYRLNVAPVGTIVPTR